MESMSRIAMEEIPEAIYNSSSWKALGLTYVEYPSHDLFGKLLAIISMVPLWISSIFTGLILRCRELHTIFFFMGIVANELLNMTLKYIIKEPRPVDRASNYMEYGMPSSHAQFMSFFTSYVIYFLLKRLNHNTPNDRIMNKLLIGVCCFLSFLVCYGRVYLLYHSVNQVLMGAVVGLISGSSWFFLVHFVLSPFLFPKIVSWKISEILLIRDTTLIPNVIFFEYTSTRLESRSRSRKKN